ncbi:metallophosphoesterase [Paenibacillus sp. J5C_2022]|uniref:metallophosphoesterase n=1 Tax=Paenibacillus sp. J5C2022 TaxID=2977129 RepID=UPI0021D3E845|nr:metallophosphoesterase [Paenibacillus sp. J5C2022]MCU6709820.1 metallophosphoesterase [Paenibacillus sp. J5C2022]
MRRRFAAMLAGILIVYGALTFYIGWNVWLFLSHTTGWKAPLPYGIVIGVLAFGYIIGRMGQSTRLRFIAQPVKYMGAYWFGFFQYAILLLPAANVAALLLRWAGAPDSVYMTTVGGITASLLILIMLRGAWNAWHPVIRKYQVTVNKNAGARTGLRIAMASDLHLGTVIGKTHLKRLLKVIDDIEADIILLAGDILDDELEPYVEKRMSEVLGRLHAPLGVFAVTGNHEYIGGKVPEFVTEMDAIGIRVLMDEAEVIDDSFIVIGRKDKAAAGMGRQQDGRGAGRATLEDLVQPFDASLPLILMDHQPSSLEEAAANGIDISLSGHTHRGQMAPNHWITRRMFLLDWGYKQIGGLHAIVSSGFGFWGPPMRIGSRSEVLQIDVVFDGSDRLVKEN